MNAEMSLRDACVAQLRKDRQADGASTTLADANQSIAAARHETPRTEQSLYRSRIVYDRQDRCYRWSWVLR